MITQLVADTVPILRRHRDACIVLARVERKRGEVLKAVRLVERARSVNRDVIAMLRVPGVRHD